MVIKFNSSNAICKLALIDILFLPFLRPLPLTISMLPVTIWAVLHVRRNTYDKVLMMVFLILSLLSLVYSFLFFPETFFDGEVDLNVWTQNIIFLGLIVLFFAYFVLFKALLPRFGPKKVYRFVLIYFLLLLGLSVCFVIDYKRYFSVRTFWTLSSSPLDVGDFSSLVRYTGMFSDPNNCAVMVVALYAILVLYETSSLLKLFLLTVACLFILLTTMSSTGFLSFFAVIPFVAYFYIKGTHDIWKKALIVVSILLFVVTLLSVLTYVQSTDIGKVALERLSGNTASTRLVKFEQMLGYDAITRLVVGTGGTVIIGTDLIRPHVGHLHFFYNYGLWAYVAFMLLVFRIRQGIPLVYYTPLIPVFLGFSANTGFIDFRFSVVASLVLAFYSINPRKLDSV
ncbi:hypothetical protein [Geobacter sp. DSM 9736]|uniref:hypothetical protein n=1 Tax=Geobacter sp. DSM 9736 TaxID=1277350 RepID=UPI000B500CE1|nr:hypothetical protein [Geobacter sp. DSM 9736]SNB45058.1 hypothetical protein SAMN06269301_0453 [Geobacter sp. DSM 9736]